MAVAAKVGRSSAARGDKFRERQAEAASKPPDGRNANLIWLDEPVMAGRVKVLGVSSERQLREVMAWSSGSAST